MEQENAFSPENPAPRRGPKEAAHPTESQATGVRVPKPEWLRIRVRPGGTKREVESILRDLSLNTICEEANCPNRIECFSDKTAAFLILGNVCTRNCTFCNVAKGRPEPVDAEEPMRIAAGIGKLRLQFAVITSVTRDDLPDGGASQWAKVIREIRKSAPHTLVEVLIPDFSGNTASLEKVVAAGPAIINHNVETVPRLYARVRPLADYGRSVDVLKKARRLSQTIITKSGIMVGLGEREEEVGEVMQDLRQAGCTVLTVGQYLPPSSAHYPIIEYVRPEQFGKYEQWGYELGFTHVASGPLVRSSYHARDALG